MHPGKYPHHATFSVPGDERDAIGNLVESPTTIGTAWVSLKPVSGREYLYAGGDKAKVTHKVTLPAPSFAIPSNARVVIAGRIFSVEAPLDAPNDAEITLMCSESR